MTYVMADPLRRGSGSAGQRTGSRIARLESFRGLGAIAVLITHCFLVVPWEGPGPQLGLIRLQSLFINGHAALMIFFVISGYVLGLSLDKGAAEPKNISRFYVRRVFRIYPAHVIAIVFIAIALSSFNHATPPPQASPAFGVMFSAPLSIIDGLLNVMLLRVTMNGVAWTLALEMAISVIFPLLYLASRHRSGFVRGGVLILLLGLSAAVGNRITQAGVSAVMAYPPGIGQAVLSLFLYVPEIINNLIFYGYVFYIGLVAEPVFQKLMPTIEGPRGAWLMWGALFFALTAKIYTAGQMNAVCLFIEVCGATVLVFCGALMKTNNRITRALDSRFWNWLGTISYSFYLYHFIVLYALGTLMFRLVTPGFVTAFPLVFVSLLSLVAFLVTATIAVVSYHRIEVPMIQYSKRASRSASVVIP
jgi:peptidoglycan/LPS O-acetylase OafA/YrhL